MNDLEEAEKFLKEKTSKISKIQTKLNEAYWNATISGKKEDYQAYEKICIELETFLNNKRDFEIIKKLAESKINDALIKRQIEILYNSYLGSQGDIKLIREIVKKATNIENKFNVFRAKIKEKDYTDNEIKNILKKETDSTLLKEAWEASKKQGELIEEKLLNLIRLRNKRAKALGFENYYEMSLRLNEQKEEDIKDIFEKLDKLTKEPFRKLKKEIDSALSERYKIPAEELKPWHYQDLFFQEGPKIFQLNLDNFYSEGVVEITKKFYETIGFSVLEILNKSDLHEKPGKYQHAYCVDIDRLGDVRVLENIKNNEQWMGTTLHELGHAIYSKNHNKTLPYLLKDAAHIFVTEAIAILFERNSRNIQFIKKYCNPKKEITDEVEKDILNFLRSKALVFSRWAQVMFNFERQLYKNPEQDLNKLWWGIVKKYQLINFSRDKPDWASKIHLVSAPVYYHNYLLGELLASQIHNYIAKKILKKDYLENLDYSEDAKVGNFLKEKIFSPGKKYSWNELIEKATGEKLNPEYFKNQFCF